MRNSVNHSNLAVTKSRLSRRNCLGSVGWLLAWIMSVHITGSVESTPDCQDLVGLVLEAEQCIDPLKTLNNISVVGSLTREQWSGTCKAYYNSIQCIQLIHQRCELAPAGSVDIGTNLQSVLQAGLGQLCVNPNSFVAYQNHEDCFMEHTTSVRLCKQTFYTEMAQLLQKMSEVPLEDSKYSLCNHYELFLTCIEDSLSTPCGHHAAKLYCGLLNAQVPAHILSLCNVNPVQSQHAEDYHQVSSATAQTLSSILTLFCIVMIHWL